MRLRQYEKTHARPTRARAAVRKSSNRSHGMRNASAPHVCKYARARGSLRVYLRPRGSPKIWEVLARCDFIGPRRGYSLLSLCVWYISCYRSRQSRVSSLSFPPFCIDIYRYSHTHTYSLCEGVAVSRFLRKIGQWNKLFALSTLGSELWRGIASDKRLREIKKISLKLPRFIFHVSWFSSSFVVIQAYIAVFS